MMNTKKKTDRTGKIFAGIVIGGSILGTAALLISAPYKTEYQSEPIAEVKAVEMEAEVVSPKTAPKKPELALPVETDGVDYVEVANQAMTDGDLKAAFTALRRSLSTQPPSVDTLLRLGRVGRDINELELAEMALLEANKLDATVADVHVELARIALRKDDFAEAHDEASVAIGLDKENAAGWNLVGRSAMSMSNWQRSEAALSRAVELDPLNAMYRNNLGLLFIHMKKADAAIDELETAVELFEDEAPHFAFNNLGLAHELAGNLEEARAAFEEALSISPFYARAKVNLERIERELDKAETDTAFDTAKAMEPTLDDVEGI